MSRTPPLMKVAALAARALLSAIAAFALLGSGAQADSASFTFITLGTQGGPQPSKDRSQPANALVRPGEAHLVDVGDGAVGRLAAADVPLDSLKSVFISHLHFDHIGGLAAVLGLRHQTRAPGKLAVYGPPGTRQLVAGINAAMQPSAEAGYGVPGEEYVAPESMVEVVELTDGSRVQLGEIDVVAAQNTHYSFEPGSAKAQRFRSLSFRFDLPDRSIVYTGDTGPSEAVERLAKGADLLVTEMIDVNVIGKRMRGRAARMSDEVREQMMQHLTTHHLTAKQISELASRAGVRKVVVTHLAGGLEAPDLERARAQIAEQFKGDVTIANDLDRF